MRTKKLSFLAVSFLGLVLVACGQTSTSSGSSSSSSSEQTLTQITFAGVEDKVLQIDDVFNAKTGVTATGNDAQDYTSLITLQSTSPKVNITTGEVDTSSAGTIAIRYNVKVGELLAQVWRNVTVETPAKPVGELIANGDFSLGTTYWDDPSVVYNGDGSELAFEVVDGVMVITMKAGANQWTPRIGQMEVPFVQEQNYKITFKAKASVNKWVAIHLGQVLPNDPWWVEFDTLYFLITPEWVTYEFSYLHTVDNKKGGILIEMGTMKGTSVDATLYFDNFTSAEVDASVDLNPPAISGAPATATVVLNNIFALPNVIATDKRDGTLPVSHKIYSNEAMTNEVESVNTSSPGKYYIKWSAEDSKGNKATETTVVTVLDLNWSTTNLVTNGDFSSPLGDEWKTWNQDWGTAPTVSHEVVGGKFAMTTSNGGGDASWAIQINQENLVSLENGATYKLTFKASSTALRTIQVALWSEGVNDYARFFPVLNTTEQSYEFIFTVDKPTGIIGKLTFELGSQEGFANSTVVIDDVSIVKAN